MQTYRTLFKFRHPLTGVIHAKGDTITGPENWGTIHAARLAQVGADPDLSEPVVVPPVAPVDPVTGGEPVKEGEGYRAYTEPTAPVTPRRKRKTVEETQTDEPPVG